MTPARVPVARAQLNPRARCLASPPAEWRRARSNASATPSRRADARANPAPHPVAEREDRAPPDRRVEATDPRVSGGTRLALGRAAERLRGRRAGTACTHVMAQTLAAIAGVGHGPANAIVPTPRAAMERRFQIGSPHWDEAGRNGSRVRGRRAHRPAPAARACATSVMSAKRSSSEARRRRWSSGLATYALRRPTLLGYGRVRGGW